MSFATLPKHLAVIMDGNGRWAKARGLSRSDGHREGTRAAKRLVSECRRLGIAHLTLYTFSRENWSRPKQEVAFLFDLLGEFLTSELPSLVERDIRLRILGEPGELPLATRTVLKRAVSQTRDCKTMTVNLALNYSGREEIVRAARRLVEDGVPAAEIDEAALAQRLYTGDQPDPDLVVRTSGEFRLSNYLLFQTAYSELYFTDVLWPDFDERELHKALEDFAGRKRRFGRTDEQILQNG
ncbi:polyprenyl diphosphate synthase [Desulfocurvus sp. DL9XJH121]